MKKLLFLLAFVTLTVIPGCGPWRTTGGMYSGDKFEVELPEGWVRAAKSDGLLMTRDGFPLQTIYIGRERVDRYKLQYTKKKLAKGMLLQELAEVLIDNMKSNPAMTNLEVKENVPARISNVPMAKIVVQFRNKDRLQIKYISYRFINDNYLYTISYTAPGRYYFDRDVKAFEKIVAGFHFLGTS